jgi:molybdopterin-binding protein
MGHDPKEDVTKGVPANNKLSAEVIAEPAIDDLFALIKIKLGPKPLNVIITKRSADQLKLKKGSKVHASIRTTNVDIKKPGRKRS